MRISEIDNQISENNQQMKALQKQVAELSRANGQLSLEKENKKMQYFLDWIEIGQQFNVNTFMWMSGVQTGIKPGDKSHTPNLQTGDIIEFVKKNAKSIVIKVITKIKSERVNGQVVATTTNPNWTFRIEIKELYNNILKDPNMNTSFKTFVIRKESLELLGI